MSTEEDLRKAKIANQVVPQQDRIWIFGGDDGDIVIEQEQGGTNESNAVWFDERFAETMCEAIMRVASRLRAGKPSAA